MKAHEVLKRYTDGRRDFSGENLKGQSFKGKDLSGANFSESDIRGTNFTNTKLTGANFRGANAGLQKHWASCLVVGGLLFSALTGFASASTGAFLEALLLQLPNSINPLVIAMIVLSLMPFLVVLISATRWGLEVAFQAGLITLAITVVGGGAVTILIGGISTIDVGGLIKACAIGGVLIVALAEAATMAIVLAGVGSKIFVGSLVGAVAGAVAFREVLTGAGGLASTLVLLGNYAGWRAFNGDEKYALIRSIAITFTATGGTSFRNADLTDADFTSAMLKSTDFRRANLTRIRWHKTKKLDRARLGNSILADTAVRELLISGNGENKSYAGANLHGANLTGANLNLSNLREAKLDQATFQHANLEGANLTQTSSVGTDFTHAHLTGACIEAWNIDVTTKLEQVDCRFVYLREEPDPITGDRERRPHAPEKVFEPGDFEKLYTKIMSTVQILLRNGINSEAFHLAFQKIVEENPEITPNSIQAIEKKGNDVLVTLEVPQETDKGKLEQQFFEVYELRLATQHQAKLLEAETRHSRDIKEITIAALMNNPSSNPIFNLTNEVKTENKAMNDSTDQSRKIENRDGSVTGNILGDSSTISGTVAETINQLPPSPEPEKPGIKELLVQLQAAINDPNLAEDDKTQALEQIKVLAEAGQNSNNEAAQKQAKKAMGFLKVIAEGLPSTATLVVACKDILPAIAHFFGL